MAALDFPSSPTTGTVYVAMSDPWVKPAPPGDAWRIDQIETVRLTEDGQLRLTEDGQHYRIIERDSAQWTMQPTIANPWT